MILVAYLEAMGCFIRYHSSFSFLQISFWENLVLSSQIEE